MTRSVPFYTHHQAGRDSSRCGLTGTTKISSDYSRVDCPRCRKLVELSDEMKRALVIATKHNGNDVLYAGANISRRGCILRVSASVLNALATRGLLELDLCLSDGGMAGRLTPAGLTAADELSDDLIK